MGDRCYLKLYIHGSIKSLKAFKEICEAIIAQGLTDEFEHHYTNHWKSAVPTFVTAVERNDTPSFVDCECNYANIEDLENILQEHKVAYAVDHGSGDGYSAGAWVYTPERGRVTVDTDGDDAVMTVYTIRQALANGTLEALLEEAEFACGANMPAFKAEGAVHRLLAKEIAARSLKVAA